MAFDLIMTSALLQHVAKRSVQRQVPELKSGYTVRVHQRIQEGEKERTQIFEGLVIAMKGASPENKMFTVRKVVDGVGVEKTFPLFSPVVSKIEVVRSGLVRRSKLYFMRDLTGKGARLKDKLLGQIGMLGSAPVQEEPAVEETTVVEETASEAPTEEVQTTEEVVAEAPAEETPVAEEVTEEAPAEEQK